MESTNNIKTCKELLMDYREKRDKLSTDEKPKAEKLVFKVKSLDVYNICAPFDDGDRQLIAGRVEGRDTELSEIRLFECNVGEWEQVIPDKTFARFQDPFISRIDGELILGGVQVNSDPLNGERIIGWRTLFFRGNMADELSYFASGPDHMKDIRLVELVDGGIGVFTRPQGGNGGKGKIGYIRLDSLDELTADCIREAKIYDSHFIEEEWGGANELHILTNGLIGVLGHIAYRDENDDKHYYAMTFAFDENTLEHTDIKIIAERSDFLDGPTKREDIKDVVFSGGLIRHDNGLATFYAGVSDVEAQKLVMKDPFLEYE